MRVISSALLSAGVLAMALTGLAVPAAEAQPAAAATWTVTPGGAFTGGGLFSYPHTYLDDYVTGATFTCGKFTFTGQLRSGSGLPPSIGSILGISIKAAAPSSHTCTGNGLALTVTGTDTPWPVHATSYNTATRVAYGQVTNVGLTLASSTCTASLTGKLHWSHPENRDITFSARGTLTASNVTGCTGLINNGDTLAYSAHDITNTIQVITSP